MRYHQQYWGFDGDRMRIVMIFGIQPGFLLHPAHSCHVWANFFPQENDRLRSLGCVYGAGTTGPVPPKNDVRYVRMNRQSSCFLHWWKEGQHIKDHRIESTCGKTQLPQIHWFQPGHFPVKFCATCCVIQVNKNLTQFNVNKKWKNMNTWDLQS